MKVSVIGAGNVGATVAQQVVQHDLADVVLVDVVKGMPQGKALDLLQAAPVLGYSRTVTGSNDYADIADSDAIVVTAGLARKPGMSRDDLVAKNTAITRDVARNIMTYSPESFIIVVTNPLDVMCYVMLQMTGLPRRKVMGMAGVLDSARLAAFIAAELGISPADVRAMVLGGHGDSMVPLASQTTVSGIPVGSLIPEDRLEAIFERTRKGGAEIVGLLGTGSAFYAPGASAYLMVDSLLNDTKRILPVSVNTQGEYGISDVFVGLPVKLGKGGVEKIIELDIPEAELQSLRASAEAVRKVQATLDVRA